MMKKTVKLLLLFSGLFLTNICVKSQVTVGSLAEPVKGALLDLKQVSYVDADSPTATSGGLVLPRVRLINKATLEPFIKGSDAEWLPENRSKTSRDHTALLVFNLTTSSDFQHGLYLWNGKEWEPLRSDGMIQLPYFEPIWQQGQTKVNLFQIYQDNLNATNHIGSQGSKLSLPNPVSGAKDFHYLLAEYNSTAFGSISIDESGIMTYTSIGQTAPRFEEKYINIILIRKNKK